MAEAEPALERLLALLNGFRSTQVVYVMAKLGLADHLAGSALTAAELASRVNANPDHMSRVLRLAAFFGLVAEVPGARFELTRLGLPLCSSVEASIRATAIMLGEEHYRAWGELLYSVTSGESSFEHIYGSPMFDYLAQHPDAQATFDDAMGAGTEAFLAPLVDSYDFSKVRVLVDVGGGNGSVAAMILKRSPGMTAVIYDQQQVLEAAERYLSGAGVRSRCRLVAGDFFHSVPEGGDLYLLSTIVHDWDDERAVRILRNCREVMKPAAVVVLVEAVMPEHGHPSRAPMADVNMMVMLTGRERTEREYRFLLGAADLELTRVVRVSERDSVIEGRPR